MDYSIVVAGSRGYEPGLRAFLNSFEYYYSGSGIKVHLLTFNLEEEFLEEIEKNYLKVHSTDAQMFKGYERNSAWGTKIPRFKFAAELSGVVMLADADMFFCSDAMEAYFRIAESGFIVAGANGSNFRFHEDWRKKYKLDVPDFFDYRTITSVPTIMDVGRHGKVWTDLYDYKLNIGIGADFDLQNIFMVMNNKMKDLIVIPSQQVTGIHHFMLKPDTRVIRKEGRLVTMDGLEVFMVHGKWWQDNWKNNLMTKMESYCQKYCQGERCIRGALDSWRILDEEFKKWRDL